MKPKLRITLVGFGEFEHRALGSLLRLAGPEPGAYEQVRDLAAADLVVANADHAATATQLAVLGRLGDTVFVGDNAPSEAAARLPRPIDALLLLRDLDALAAQRRADVLPAAAAAAASAPAAAAERQPRAPPAAAAASALLVDDSTIALRFLQSRLKRFGIASDTALNSERALELLAHRPYAYVFIDVELGAGSALDGLALCQHLKRQHHPVGGRAPVLVLVSAHASELDRARGAFAGCDDYLAKPADDAALQRLLSRPRMA